MSPRLYEALRSEPHIAATLIDLAAAAMVLLGNNNLGEKVLTLLMVVCNCIVCENDGKRNSGCTVFISDIPSLMR